MSANDRIEKQIVVRAPRTKVWRAIADHQEFGRWFGMRLAAPFVPGTTVHGRIEDPPGYADLDVQLFIERVEPETLVALRWHPYAIDPKVDYSSEPTTLVELRLADTEGGTLITVTES